MPGFPVESQAAASEVDVRATPRTVTEGQTRVKLHLRVRSAGDRPTGTVRVVVDGTTYDATLRHGRAQVRLRPFTSAGTRTVHVDYLGDDVTEPSSTSADIMVRPRPGHGHPHAHGPGH